MKKRRKTVPRLPTAPIGPAACLRSAGIRGVCPGCDEWKLLTHSPTRLAGRYCSAECCPCCAPSLPIMPAKVYA